MENIFLHLLNMSITASWIALAVIVLRFLLKKTPKWIMGVLWGFVALRLICPFSFESVFSLIPSTETVPTDITMSNAPAINSGIPFINQAVNPVISGSLAPSVADSVNPLQVLTLVLSIVWVIGIAAMLIYTAVSYIRLRLKVTEAVMADGGAWICDNIPTPFILGIFRPKIYLPSSMNEATMSYVLSHEKAHLKRRDYIWKPLGFLLLAVYWFNPVLWVAYILLCRDIELACDEKVIRDRGEGIKKPYSEALINCSVPRRMIAACPLAFGEVGVKGRIKHVLSYKKPTFRIVLAAVAACLVTAVCLLTNPQSKKLMDIEHRDLSNTLNNTVAVMISDDGESFCGAKFDDLILERIGNIGISSKEVSPNRGDDREKTNVIVLQNQNNSKPTIYSSLPGTYICFNSNFTEVWVNDGVKPTLTYRVLDSQTARKAFRDILDRSGNPFIPGTGGAEDPRKAITEIIDRAETENIPTDQAFELFYSDDSYNYSFSSIKSQYVIVKFADGTTKTVKEALADSEITIADLDEYGIHYYRQSLWAIQTSSRSYTFNSSVEPVVKPSIALSSDGNRFQFIYSALSSYIPTGRYELTEDTLSLKTDDGNNIYVFNVKGDTFVFDASKSSEIPKFAYSSGAKAECPVPDGAAFE